MATVPAHAAALSGDQPAPGTEAAGVASSTPVYPAGNVLPVAGQSAAAPARSVGGVAVPAPSPAAAAVVTPDATAVAEPAKKGSFLTRWFN